MNEATPTPFAVVIGRQLKAVREERRELQEDIARRARHYGLPWTRGTVASIELGRREVSWAESMLLPGIYQRELPDLIGGGKDWVALTPQASMRHDLLPEVLRGHFLEQLPADLSTPGLRRLREIDVPEVLGNVRKRAQRIQQIAPGAKVALVDQAEQAAAGEAEGKAARRLGVAPADLSIAAFGRWGRSLTDERDRRVFAQGKELSSRALQAVRGHVTRALLDELRPILEEAQ